MSIELEPATSERISEASAGRCAVVPLWRCAVVPLVTSYTAVYLSSTCRFLQCPQNLMKETLLDFGVYAVSRLARLYSHPVLLAKS